MKSPDADGNQSVLLSIFKDIKASMASFPLISVPIQRHEPVHGCTVQVLILNVLNLSL